MSSDEFDFQKGFGRIWTVIAYCLGYSRANLMPFNMKVKRFKESS
ncbi:MAG TPA: hypothetical protein VJI71_00205 [Candidatus Norongarragalinales archaeon]|nr:hypothetical protein [Candidatus Norongarragalinales archaeon]